jgi:hypothetical protein
VVLWYSAMDTHAGTRASSPDTKTMEPTTMSMAKHWFQSRPYVSTPHFTALGGVGTGAQR